MGAGVTLDMNAFTIIATLAQLFVSLVLPFVLIFLNGARGDLRELSKSVGDLRVVIASVSTRLDVLERERGEREDARDAIARRG